MKQPNHTTEYGTVERLARLKHLLRSAHSTRAEIAECIREYAEDKSYRKLRRDLHALEQLGFKLESDRATGTFHLVALNVEVDWSEGELQALAALRECFRDGAPYAQEIGTILGKLAGDLGPAARRVLEHEPPLTIALEASPETRGAAASLRKLEQALLHHQRVSFDYRPSERQRIVHHPDDEPLGLEFREGHYYLTAYCFKMNTVFDYRVDQVVPESLRILPTRAVRGWKRKMVDFQYRLSPKIAARGPSARFPEMDWEPQPDGSLLVTARGYDKFRIIREILRYGEQAEIISPEWLRAEMLRVAREMARLYG